MFRKLLNYINSFLLKGHERSIKAKKNIIISFFLKGISIIVGFLYIPLLAKYLGNEEYGIWLTLSSFAAWVGFFDIGLGNGLRNKFAEAIAAKNTELARKYVSTSYSLISIFILGFLLLFYIIAPMINWQTIFNSHSVSKELLFKISIFAITFFSIRFILQLIKSILFADQRPALASSFNVISNMISLITIYLITLYTTDSSLLLVSIILTAVPVITLLLSSIFFFTNQYKKFRPSFKYIDFRYSKDLLGLGVKFFAFQIYGLILVSSTNILISQLITPSEVPVYYAAYKYFSITTMIFGIILTPLWSATTEAFVKKEFQWIKNVIKKLRKAAIFLAIIAILMLMVSDFVYGHWVGGLIKIPFDLSLILAIQSMIYLFFSPYVSFLNGVGKLNLNLILILVDIIIYIPLAIFFVKYLSLGITGIVLASLIAEIPLRIFQPLQYHFLINNKATGIWNR